MVRPPHGQRLVRANPNPSLRVGGQHFYVLTSQAARQRDRFGFLAAPDANGVLALQIPDPPFGIGALLALWRNIRQRHRLPVPLLARFLARQQSPVVIHKYDPARRRPQQAGGLIRAVEHRAKTLFVPRGHAAINHADPKRACPVHHQPRHAPFL